MSSSPGPRPVVAVVGGGIAGLAAAWELVTAGAGGDSGPEVHVFEASDRTGGKMRTAEFAGRRVDLAADGFLARRPEATDLCAELGLEDTLVPVGASGASIWARGRLRMMPDGLNLGVPTRWWPLFRSGILSPVESIGVAKDLVKPHLRTGMTFGDRSVGRIVGDRLGRPVVERMVDPLVGGIQAGGVDELSAAATFPVLIAASDQPGSLMRALGRVMRRPSPSSASSAPAPPATSPAFWSLPDGTASLAELLAAELQRRGVVVHTSTPVESVEWTGDRGPGPSRWQLTLGRTASAGTVDGNGSGPGTVGGDRTADGPEADGLVLAVPAREAAVLLAPHAPVAAGMLSTIEYASVAVVTLALPPGAVTAPLRGTGFLVPRTSTIDGRPSLITGVTYLSRKWPNLSRPDDELIRASVGRYGDERHALMDDAELTASVLGELDALLGVRHPPLHASVTRWQDALPQYEVGHLLRVGRIDQDVAGLGAVGIAGATLRGVGIPACIGSGRAAAQRVLASLGHRSGPASS